MKVLPKRFHLNGHTMGLCTDIKVTASLQNSIIHSSSERVNLLPNNCMEAFLTAHDEDAKPLTAIMVPFEAYCSTEGPRDASW